MPSEIISGYKDTGGTVEAEWLVVTLKTLFGVIGLEVVGSYNPPPER